MQNFYTQSNFLFRQKKLFIRKKLSSITIQCIYTMFIIGNEHFKRRFQYLFWYLFSCSGDGSFNLANVSVMNHSIEFSHFPLKHKNVPKLTNSDAFVLECIAEQERSALISVILWSCTYNSKIKKKIETFNFSPNILHTNLDRCPLFNVFFQRYCS